MELKKEGKIKSSSFSTNSNNGSTTSSEPQIASSSAIDDYADKIQAKMGKSKSKLLSKINPKFSEAIQSSTSSTLTKPQSTNDNDNDIENDDDFELDENEEEMLKKVEEKLLEKRALELEMEKKEKELMGKTSDLGPDIDDLAEQMEREIENKRKELQQQQQQGQQVQQESVTPKTTTGIGGTWEKNPTSEVETYRPANGGWGYFPRPKDISRAYGGGKKIEPTSTYEDELQKQNSVNDTREKLRQYRERVGIEVQSEKDHEEEIEAALSIGQLAMQRGVYNAAVSALEKVTKYCSTNSKLGGKVFLELAMAYEAVGRTNEAIQVYSTLCNSRMEDIKFNAKRLLYGIESMKFMREELKSEAFSRKRVTQTFIDTTGLANISQNFDEKIYNTAYVDLDKGGGFYRKLSENVVRSIREARQILLAATDSGQVDRLKIVQALRSIDRKFTDALAEEKKRNAPKPEPTAIMNGKPIIKQEDLESTTTVGMDTFNLGDLDQILDNVNGEWKLQLMADSKGDGVSFFNKTLSWQYFDSSEMIFDASGPAGFLTIRQSGKFEIDKNLRIMIRKEVKNSGSGAFVKDLLGQSNLSGSLAATNLEQQIISVDSEILITRAVVEKKSTLDMVKGYFSVWRRAETGLYSGKQ